MFQCLILFFRLLIRLRMKNNIQFAFYANAITQRELIITREKRITIKYNFFYFEKNQKHFIEKYVCEVFNRLCQFREYVKRHFRITIDYNEYNIIYVVFITIKWELNNEIHWYFLSRTKWYEKQRQFIVKTMLKRFHTLTDIATLNIFFYIFQHFESIKLFL